jgi:hypothetical protein
MKIYYLFHQFFSISNIISKFITYWIMFLKNHWRMNWIQSKSKIAQQYCIYRRTKRQRFLDCISRRAHNVLFRSIKKPTMILTRGHHDPFPSFWCVVRSIIQPLPHVLKCFNVFFLFLKGYFVIKKKLIR